LLRDSGKYREQTRASCECAHVTYGLPMWGHNERSSGGSPRVAAARERQPLTAPQSTAARNDAGRLRTFKLEKRAIIPTRMKINNEYSEFCQPKAVLCCRRIQAHATDSRNGD
jgi:hypothetical protein